MLTIFIPEQEYFDEVKEEIVTLKAQKLELEHSLISLRKWESKWHIPYLSQESLTLEQTIDYIRCMTLNKNVDPTVYFRLSNKDIAEINRYLEEPMTATWFREDEEEKKKNGKNSNPLTAEIIYYYMTALNIDFKCEQWHLNQLLTLIKVCSIKNSPQKKKSKQQILAEKRALNESRKKKYNTKG